MVHGQDFDWRLVTGIGLYPVGLASRILGEKHRTVASWIEGYPNSEAAPIIKRQLPQIGGRTVLGFLDLVEARFVKHFSDAGLSPQTIRKVAMKLREKHHEDHPFATKHRFRTDGRKIFQEVVETEEEKKVIDVMSDNFVMPQMIEQSLFESIFYGDDLAYRWKPFKRLPRIVLDPKIAFGRPVIDGSWAPTHVLYNSYVADGCAALVADDYGVTEEDVLQAVELERTLAEKTTVH